MGVIRRYNICSDMHRADTSCSANVSTARAAYAASGYKTICAGDWKKTTGWQDNMTEIRNSIADFKTLPAGFLTITGNHDFGQGCPLTLEDRLSLWREVSGMSGWVMQEDIGHNTVLLMISGQKCGYANPSATNTPVYDKEIIDDVISRLNALSSRRVIVVTHYCPNGKPDGNGMYTVNWTDSVRADWAGIRAGYHGDYTPGSNVRGYILNEKGGERDRSDRDFFEAIASKSNILWINGHNHTPWDADEIVNEHIHAATFTGGASICNIPSLGHQGEDAMMTVTDDGIYIQARKIVDGTLSDISDQGYWWDGSKIEKRAAMPGGDEPDEPVDPDDPDDPTPPSGGVLSVPLRLASGGTITRVEELPNWVRERLSSGEKLLYMKDGVRHEVTWTEVEADYEYNLDGGVLTIVRAPCMVEGGVLKIE